jgi:hypothetical protein
VGAGLGRDAVPVLGADGTRIRWTPNWDNTLLGRMAWRGLRTVYPEIVANLAAAERDTDQSP